MRRAVLIFLAAGSLLLLGSLLLGAVRAFTVLAAAFPVALMALGMLTRRREVGPPARLFPAALVVLLLLLEIGLLTLLQLRGRVQEAAWPLGLPVSSWILLVGLGLAPLLLIPWAYAASFRDHGLTEADLERIRELRDGSRGTT